MIQVILKSACSQVKCEIMDEIALPRRRREVSRSNEVYTCSAPFSHDLLPPLGSDEYCLRRQIKIIMTSSETFCAGQVASALIFVNFLTTASKLQL